jgi:hypothetical protein
MPKCPNAQKSPTPHRILLVLFVFLTCGLGSSASIVASSLSETNVYVRFDRIGISENRIVVSVDASGECFRPSVVEYQVNGVEQSHSVCSHVPQRLRIRLPFA